MVKAKNKTNRSPLKKAEQLLHPDGTNAYFANYFTIESSTDDFVVSFGQKLPASDPKKDVYEIRKRVVMTPRGAKIFNDLISKSLEKLKSAKIEEKK